MLVSESPDGRVLTHVAAEMAANRAVGSDESAIFMIEARLPAENTLAVTSQEIAATRY
ncbi:hypothetical protein GCM10027200_01990 [Lentzea nigeriaca]